MNFEELINSTRNVKAPELKMKKSGKMSAALKRKSIIEQLKWVDARTLWGIRIIQLLYIFFILILVSILVFSKKTEIQIGIGFIAVAFLMVILVQQLRFWKYNYSYTDKPVLDFLKDAKKRMRVFTSRTWLVIPIWIFIDIGFCIILAEIFPLKQYISVIIVLLQFVLLLAVVLDFYSAYLFWKKEHKPVIIEIEKMLEEIETSTL